VPPSYFLTGPQYHRGDYCAHGSTFFIVVDSAPVGKINVGKGLRPSRFWQTRAREQCF
jgi:hypothetical protein